MVEEAVKLSTLLLLLINLDTQVVSVGFGKQQLEQHVVIAKFTTFLLSALLFGSE